MKKIIITAFLVILTSLTTYADEVSLDNISLLSKKGFFKNTSKSVLKISSEDEIKRTFNNHYKYSNEHNLEALADLYSDNYCNEDGFNKKLYFELIKKTWKAYPNVKYKISIKSISVNENTAVVHINENACAETPTNSAVVNEKGFMESFSDTIYYLEKVSNQWLVVSDKIIFEKTILRYGSAKNMYVNLIAPSQVPAGKDYTVSLQINPDKNLFVIGSIGQESITYPQTVSEDVFRKLPKDGMLERMFKANTKNLNEYVSASYGITKAEASYMPSQLEKDVKIYITGIGFLTQRVNIIPQNNFIKAEDEKEKNEENK